MSASATYVTLLCFNSHSAAMSMPNDNPSGRQEADIGSSQHAATAMILRPETLKRLHQHQCHLLILLMITHALSSVQFFLELLECFLGVTAMGSAAPV
jgi:hypothetical protein